MTIKDVTTTVLTVSKEMIFAFKLAIKEVSKFLKYIYKEYESSETYREVSSADDLIKSQY